METTVLAEQEAAYNLGMIKPIFQVLSQHPKLPISKIEYKDLKLEFFKPYIMTVKIEGEYLVHENMRMNMIVRGNTLEEVVEEFFADMYCLWHDIVLVDESKLHPSAIKLKNYLISIAREVG